MLKVKPFLFILFLTVFVALFTTACSDSGSSSGGGYDNSTTNPGSDTDKSGVTAVNEFPANPLALLGIYNVTSQYVDGTSQEVVAGSEFRVNVDTKRLSQQYVDVLVRIKINGKTIDFQREVSLAGNAIGFEFFEKIFTEMGAKVTGRYTLEFTLASSAYDELVKEGIITDGQTLVMSLDKTKDLTVDSGLGDNTENPDEPSNPEEPGTVPVESIAISGQPANVVHGGAPFKLTASVLPNNATNKVVTWSSSHPDYISVDNQGNVTIKGYTTGTITITATSNADNSKKDEWTFNIEKAAVTDISVIPAEMTLTLRKDGSTVSANITTAIEPAIATDYTSVKYEVTSGQYHITVDPKGVVTAVKEGNATVTVTAAGLTKTVTVTVNPAPTVEIPVTNITVTTSADKVYKKGTNVAVNFTLTPANTTDNMVSYSMQSGSGHISTANGSGLFELTNVQGGETVTFTTAKGQHVSYTVKAVDGIDTISFVQETITVEQTKSGSNELNNKEAIQNSISSITYESLTTDLASVDSSTGVVTGLKNGLATIKVTVQPKYESAPLTAQYKVDVLGLVDFSSNDAFIASAQGTYNITFFGTSPGNASGGSGIMCSMVRGQTNVPVTNDCGVFEEIFGGGRCVGTTFASQIEVEKSKLAGQMTISIDNQGSASISTKVLMTHADIIKNSQNDQYQYTVYRPTYVTNTMNSSIGSTVTDIKGRNLTTDKLEWSGSTFEVKQYQNNLSKTIQLYSVMQNKVISAGGCNNMSINPKTYIIAEKTSSQVIKMDYSDVSSDPFSGVTGVNPAVADFGKDAPTY